MLSAVVAFYEFHGRRGSSLARVDPGLVESFGAVSEEVVVALADGARAMLGADVGVGVTGIAGPEGGSDAKPVGLVWLSVSHRAVSYTHLTLPTICSV